MSENNAFEEVTIERVMEKGVATYTDGRLVLIEHFRDQLEMKRVLKLEMPLLTFCTSGTMSCEVEGRKYEFGCGDAVLCLPQVYLADHRASADYEAKVIGLSFSALQRNVLRTGRDLFDMIQYKKDHPVIKLDGRERDVLWRYYELIRLTMGQADDPFHDEVMAALFQAVFCEICGVVSRRMAVDVGGRRGIRREDWLFKRFLKQLVDSKGCERSVTVFARQLNVTPKYLSTVVKTVSGRTALDWIHEYTAEIMAHELKYTEKTIKEIAYALNFPSLSFFGKFCKSRLGMSPKEYRNRMGHRLGMADTAADA